MIIPFVACISAKPSCGRWQAIDRSRSRGQHILPDVAIWKQWPFRQSELRRAGPVKQLCTEVSASAMMSKPTHEQPAAVHFPTAREKGPFPFPTSQSMAQQKAGTGQPEEPGAEELSAEELRLMADTMPGDGPGD
jgi:hypothetical protein